MFVQITFAACLVSKFFEGALSGVCTLGSFSMIPTQLGSVEMPHSRVAKIFSVASCEIKRRRDAFLIIFRFLCEQIIKERFSGLGQH